MTQIAYTSGYDPKQSRWLFECSPPGTLACPKRLTCMLNTPEQIRTNGCLLTRRWITGPGTYRCNKFEGGPTMWLSGVGHSCFYKGIKLLSGDWGKPDGHQS